ncbi:hypothetical protein L7F22_052045 [Adiantum nelumboides]|nr:hypothetical protein [Adiantum nelumboides]
MGSKARAEERRKKKMKKKSKKHRYSSSPPASSPSSTESSTSSDETRKLKKRRHRHDSDSESSGRKHRRTRHSTHIRRGEKHAQKEACNNSASDENRGRPSPQEVAFAMLCKFPELANDLKQLLKMLDDGQAVDLTGLTNEHVAAYLKQLFQSLLLQKTVQGLYFLPDGASRKTLDVLSSVLSSSEQIKNSGQQDINKEEKDSPQLANEDGRADHYGPVEQKRRVIGPAMPSAEMLEAAARLTAAGPSPREADEDISMEPFVGPPPPAAVKEAESANEAERFEEVERIIAPDVGNAYELMALRVGASADLMKKRYWKLSLLVHPDKCTHPRAHEAFTALNQAFKDLQDPIKRTKIDQQIQEKETREEFEAELKAKREAAEWRKIRGESLPGDDALLYTSKAMVRDEWMTQLPPERKAGAPTQQSTFFSRSVKSGRGDTSVWTDTPMDKVRKARMGFLEGERQSMLSNESDHLYKEERYPASAEIMDQFNSVKRGMSLVEKHQMEHTKVKKASNKREALQPAEWVASHPWKPWDRDKDLTAGRQKVDLDKSNMAEGLTSRFSSSHKERNFL